MQPIRIVRFDKVRSNFNLTSRRSNVLPGVRVKQTNELSLYDVKDQAKSKLKASISQSIVLSKSDAAVPTICPSIGGARRDRTDDLLNANQALSQLRYGPSLYQQDMVGLGRFELPTSRLSGVRSNQLSYRPKF